jgi:hypothetical protein
VNLSLVLFFQSIDTPYCYRAVDRVLRFDNLAYLDAKSNAKERPTAPRDKRRPGPITGPGFGCNEPDPIAPFEPAREAFISSRAQRGLVWRNRGEAPRGLAEAGGAMPALAKDKQQLGWQCGVLISTGRATAKWSDEFRN